MALDRTTGTALHSANEVTLLRNGAAAYDDWLAVIGRAQRWIHLENYIFRSDQTGWRFAEALAGRARAGVAVRVLWDAFGSRDTAKALWAELARAGVDVRAFNPLRLLGPAEFIHRDHRKVLGVDGRYAAVGGIGLGDAWIERDPASGLYYRDTAVRIEGPVVADVERAFARAWQQSGDPLPEEEIPNAASIPPAGVEPARLVAQEPGLMRISRVLQVVMAGVRHRLWITDAYFLADPMLRQGLIAAARDGVDVRLLLPSATDAPLVGIMSRIGYRPLLAAGVRIWEYRGPMIHAKTTVADGWWSRVGSTNLNITGLLTNWEIDLLVEHRAFGAEMEAMFQDDLADADPVRLEGGRVTGGAPAGEDSKPRGAIPGAGAPIARVGTAALRLASGAALDNQERQVELALGGAGLIVALAAVRLPRVVAWLLGGISAALGATSIAHALSAWRRQPTRPPDSP